MKTRIITSFSEIDTVNAYGITTSFVEIGRVNIFWSL